ncbi:MAG: hypothetical protein ACE5JG_03260 [Planctomycetota bacterium]
MKAPGRLRPAFELGGSGTAGNSGRVADGAAALPVGDPARPER